MVRFNKVTKRFGSLLALDDVSFGIEPGEFVFITGPSGAGKTTVLRLILKDFAPNTGEIVVAGKNIITLKGAEIPLYRRLIGMVFQDFKLLGDRTVGENIGLTLAVAGVPSRAREAKVKAVLEQVGMKEKINSFPQQLAGGEIQRVVIARALVGRPKILLADEPTGNLDPDTAWGIIELLEEVREGGTTVIMATHNKDIVDKKKGRVIHLQGGKVARDKKGAKYGED